MGLPAVVLVGGQGTRLRPLTDRTRKDMLPLVDRPLLAYTFDHLRRYGVERTVVSCGYMPTQIREFFGDAYDGMGLDYRVEPEPLGTGGGIGFAAEGIDETFFALNGDSLREADLDELVRFHRAKGARATILLTPVDDPGRYGLVRLGADGCVLQFVEKPRPEQVDTDLINAGLYVLEPSVLDLVSPGRPVSIERDVFPRLCEEGSVYGLALPGYWLDVGNPASYLEAHRDILERSFTCEVGEALGPDFVFVHETAVIHPRARLVPPVYVGARAEIGEDVRVGSLAAVGADVRLERGVTVENAVLGDRAVLEEGATVTGSIVGEGARVGRDVTVAGLSVVGPGATVGRANEIDRGLRISADVTIPEEALRTR